MKFLLSVFYFLKSAGLYPADKSADLIIDSPEILQFMSLCSRIRVTLLINIYNNYTVLHMSYYKELDSQVS